MLCHEDVEGWVRGVMSVRWVFPDGGVSVICVEVIRNRLVGDVLWSLFSIVVLLSLRVI